MPVHSEAELTEKATVSALPWARGKEFLLLPEKLEGLAILDVGGGASDITATLLEQGANAFALDPKYRKRADIEATITANLRFGQPNMQVRMAINQAYKRFMASIKASPERYKAASATQMPFPDATFDIVFSIDTLTAFFDFNREVLMQCARECVRVTKPGGLVILLPFQDAQPAWAAQLNQLRLANDEHLLNWLKTHPEIEGVEITNTAVRYHHRLTFRKKAASAP